MIQIKFIETVYAAPADEEEDYCPDGDASSTDDTVGFRELVALMRQQYSQPSCSPASGATSEWLSDWPDQDYRTGDWTERSMHYAPTNPPRSARYWKLAMRAAGII
jgi:hypothetical protein